MLVVVSCVSEPAHQFLGLIKCFTAPQHPSHNPIVQPFSAVSWQRSCCCNKKNTESEKMIMACVTITSCQNKLVFYRAFTLLTC